MTLQPSKCGRFLTAMTVLCMPAFGAAQTQPDAAFDLALDSEEAMPQVLTTTKLRQPKSRVPATTTVLTGELIRDLGIRHLWEVFRLVPGMTVGYVQSNKPVVSYHGTVADEQRRLQVQVDGRTAYRPNIADMDWHAMPVAIEDIERIEITRGPNSAAYGINAFLATINIITFSPEDTHGSRVSLRAGDLGYRQAYGSVGGGADQHDWRLSVQRRESDGFDYRFEDEGDSQDKSEVRKPFDDSYRFNIINYSSTYDLTDQDALDLRLGYVEVYDEEDAAQYGKAFGIVGVPAETGDDFYGQLKWTHSFSDSHQVHIQAGHQTFNRRQRWRSLVDPEDLGQPEGLPELGTDVNQDIKEQRLEFEIQDTLSVTEDLRMVAGVGYREDRFESDTFFNGSGSNYQTLVFGNLEYTPWHRLTLNTGASWEKTTSVDDSFFSPRVAANFQLTDYQTLRLVYSRAVRTPDAFEQNADWGYRGSNVTPEALYGGLEGQRLLEFVAPGNLDEEHITSREISYLGQFRMGQGMLFTEVKLFSDKLRDVISGRIAVDRETVELPDGSTVTQPRWNLDNVLAIDQKGLEIEGMVQYPDTTVRLTYAYLDQDTEYRGPANKPANEIRLYKRLQGRLSAEHSGSLAWIQRYPGDISSAAAWYTAHDLGEYPYNRVDLRLAKAFYLPRFNWEVAARLEHYPNGGPIMFYDNNYNDDTHYFFDISAKF
ncbi:iron complex outermembrane recepter protein [Marinobacter daqiaonensis]|uniref:Iron complex outermembrane recepter protein n=1 Tax=Marinobacter daqiaonensis TaxID=650891 RepID=A0A1I6HLL3_9GAMM|nr:TonB-dependent receptor [Marinobacter daqiaonensis]SFR55342.1 iron complex outermembrane recepter protein [Marinobacter daqiaonensis]